MNSEANPWQPDETVADRRIPVAQRMNDHPALIGVLLIVPLLVAAYCFWNVDSLLAQLASPAVPPPAIAPKPATLAAQMHKCAIIGLTCTAISFLTACRVLRNSIRRRRQT